MEKIIRELVAEYTAKRKQLQDAIDGNIEDYHSEKWNKSKFTTLNEVIVDLERILKNNNSLRSIKSCFSEAVDEIDSNGLECGIEDLGITDRYEAMQYGFDQCKERALEAIEITAD